MGRKLADYDRSRNSPTLAVARNIVESHDDRITQRKGVRVAEEDF
jgi:hypothetical protein